MDICPYTQTDAQTIELGLTRVTGGNGTPIAPDSGSHDGYVVHHGLYALSEPRYAHLLGTGG